MSPDPADYAAKDIGWQALGPAIACTAAATLVVAVRWYTRLKLSRCHGLDDFVITLSLLTSWAMTGVIAAEVHDGIGVYSEKSKTEAITKLVIVANNLWVLTVNITKASILAQYLRIFQNRNTQILCIILLVLLLPAALWGTLGGTLLCSPVAKLWKPFLPGHCVDLSKYWLATAGVDIGLDVLVLLLPLPAISSLRLGKRQKFMLVFFFALGFCVCGFSIARLFTVHIVALQGDLVSSGVWAIIWSTIEANVGIICASLLALKPLVARFFPNLLEDREAPRHHMHIRVPTNATSQEAILAAANRSMTQRSSEGREIRASMVRSLSRTLTLETVDTER